MDSDKALIVFWLFEEYLLSLRRYWNYIQPIPTLMVVLATASWTKEQIKTLQQKQELSPENTGITWFCVKVLKVFKIILLCPVFLCKQVNALGRWNDSDSKNWRSSPITQVQCSDSTERTNTQTHATLRAPSFNFTETSSSIIPRSVLLYSLKKHNNNNKAEAGDVAQFVECLPNTQKV